MSDLHEQERIPSIHLDSLDHLSPTTTAHDYSHNYHVVLPALCFTH